MTPAICCLSSSLTAIARSPLFSINYQLPFHFTQPVFPNLVSDMKYDATTSVTALAQLMSLLRLWQREDSRNCRFDVPFPNQLSDRSQEGDGWMFRVFLVANHVVRCQFVRLLLWELC